MFDKNRVQSFCEALRKINLLLLYQAEVLTATGLIVVQQASAVAACRSKVVLEYILIGHFVNKRYANVSYYYRIFKIVHLFNLYYVVNCQNLPFGKSYNLIISMCSFDSMRYEISSIKDKLSYFVNHRNLVLLFCVL